MVKIGQVTNLEISVEDMKITHLIIKMGKQSAKEILGKRRLVRQQKVKVDIQNVEAIKDAVILRQSLDELKGILQKV